MKLLIQYWKSTQFHHENVFSSLWDFGDRFSYIECRSLFHDYVYLVWFLMAVVCQVRLAVHLYRETYTVKPGLKDCAVGYKKFHHSWDWILELFITGLLQGAWSHPTMTESSGRVPMSSFSYSKTSCYLTWLKPKTSMHVCKCGLSRQVWHVPLCWNVCPPAINVSLKAGFNVLV